MHPTQNELLHFDTLADLSKDQLGLLCHSLSIHEAPKGKSLIKLGATEAYSFLLLTGKVELTARDGRKKIIEGGTPNARVPVAQLLPRQYAVTSLSPVTYLEIDSQLLESLREPTEPIVDHSEDTLLHGASFGIPMESALLDRLRRDLAEDTLVLPSLPEIALRLGRALDDEITDAKRIAEMVQTDPAITAKLIKVANSALYSGRRNLESCADAVVRLGINTTHKLVLSFVLRELFRARSPLLRSRMQTLWRHSTRVGAICFVLARLTRQFQTEEALLAGLVHDIGEVAILTYAERFSRLASREDDLDRALAALRGKIGGIILEKWEFPKQIVTAARDAEHWDRDPDPEADYADLVIIAQLHSYVGTPHMQDLPKMGELPCFEKLDIGELTPRMSLEILDKAEDQLARAEQLFGGE